MVNQPFVIDWLIRLFFTSHAFVAFANNINCKHLLKNNAEFKIEYNISEAYCIIVTPVADLFIGMKIKWIQNYKYIIKVNIDMFQSESN